MVIGCQASGLLASGSFQVYCLIPWSIPSHCGSWKVEEIQHSQSTTCSYTHCTQVSGPCTCPGNNDVDGGGLTGVTARNVKWGVLQPFLLDSLNSWDCCGKCHMFIISLNLNVVQISLLVGLDDIIVCGITINNLLLRNNVPECC